MRGEPWKDASAPRAMVRAISSSRPGMASSGEVKSRGFAGRFAAAGPGSALGSSLGCSVRCSLRSSSFPLPRRLVGG